MWQLKLTRFFTNVSATLYENILEVRIEQRFPFTQWLWSRLSTFSIDLFIMYEYVMSTSCKPDTKVDTLVLKIDLKRKINLDDITLFVNDRIVDILDKSEQTCYNINI